MMLSCANKGKGSVVIKQCLSSLAVQSKDEEHTVSVWVGTTLCTPEGYYFGSVFKDTLHLGL